MSVISCHQLRSTHVGTAHFQKSHDPQAQVPLNFRGPTLETTNEVLKE